MHLLPIAYSSGQKREREMANGFSGFKRLVICESYATGNTIVFSRGEKKFMMASTKTIARLSILNLNEYHLLTVHSIRSYWKKATKTQNRATFSSGNENEVRYPIQLSWRIIVSETIHHHHASHDAQHHNIVIT